MRLARLSVARLTCIVFALVALTAPAWTLAAAPPQPSLRRYPPAWIGFLVIGVLLAVVVLVSLRPSKRGHQD
jgi:hypothetical protein